MVPALGDVAPGGRILLVPGLPVRHRLGANGPVELEGVVDGYPHLLTVQSADAADGVPPPPGFNQPGLQQPELRLQVGGRPRLALPPGGLQAVTGLQPLAGLRYLSFPLGDVRLPVAERGHPGMSPAQAATRLDDETGQGHLAAGQGQHAAPLVFRQLRRLGRQFILRLHLAIHRLPRLRGRREPARQGGPRRGQVLVLGRQRYELVQLPDRPLQRRDRFLRLTLLLQEGGELRRFGGPTGHQILEFFPGPVQLPLDQVQILLRIQQVCCRVAQFLLHLGKPGRQVPAVGLKALQPGRERPFSPLRTRPFPQVGLCHRSLVGGRPRDLPDKLPQVIPGRHQLLGQGPQQFGGSRRVARMVHVHRINQAPAHQERPQPVGEVAIEQGVLGMGHKHGQLLPAAVTGNATLPLLRLDDVGVRGVEEIGLGVRGEADRKHRFRGGLPRLGPEDGREFQLTLRPLAEERLVALLLVLEQIGAVHEGKEAEIFGLLVILHMRVIVALGALQVATKENPADIPRDLVGVGVAVENEGGRRPELVTGPVGGQHLQADLIQGPALLEALAQPGAELQQADHLAPLGEHHLQHLGEVPRELLAPQQVFNHLSPDGLADTRTRLQALQERLCFHGGGSPAHQIEIDAAVEFGVGG